MISCDLPVGPADLEKLARWIPEKEMALLIEICERAKHDPDLTRPALLLCAAYGERVAKAYPKNASGQTLFPFRRLFMVARRRR